MSKRSFRFSAVLVSVVLASLFLIWEPPTAHAAFVITPLVPSQATACDELIIQGTDEQLVPHPNVDSIFLFNIDTLSIVEKTGAWGFGDGFGSALCNANETPEDDADDLPVGNYALVIVHQEGGQLPYKNCVNPFDFGYVGFQTTVCFDGLFLFSIVNTPTGTNVVVEPTSDTDVTFSSVTSVGQTTVASSSSGPTVSSNFKLGSPAIYYDVSTTATFSSTVTVCITYDEGTFQNEANAKLLHYENNKWTDVTTSLDTVNNVICGLVTSFSPFTLVENLTVNYISNEVRGFNLDSGIEQGLLAKLDAVIMMGDNENASGNATNVLGAFINLVNAQEGKKLTTLQAEVLLVDTRALIDSLNGNV